MEDVREAMAYEEEGWDEEPDPYYSSYKWWQKIMGKGWVW